MVEIYGIPTDTFKCPACISAINWCKHYKIPYKFIPILNKTNDSMGFAYDKLVIEELRRRAGKRTAPNKYPQIFVDDKWVGGFYDLKRATSEYQMVRAESTAGD